QQGHHRVADRGDGAIVSHRSFGNQILGDEMHDLAQVLKERTIATRHMGDLPAPERNALFRRLFLKPELDNKGMNILLEWPGHDIALRLDERTVAVCR